MIDLDPRMTFDNYVVGPANRLATAAARRAGDSPGTSYNPLFLYSASGLGKSHILSAVAHHALRSHQGRKVVYQPLEGYLDELTKSLESGDQEGMRARYRDLEILLLDDVQFLTGQTQAQELLLRTLDSLAAQGSQVVLASDRPPAEINGLDARLLSRFSGGLIVDIGPPDYETRVAIMRKKVDERNARLLPGVAEAMARHPYKNVRELQGALNRVLAVQDLEDRQVSTDEISSILGIRDSEAEESAEPKLEPVFVEPEDEGSAWKTVLEKTVSEADAEGFSTVRLRRILRGTEAPADIEQTVKAYRADMARLREIGQEMGRLGNPWPEAERTILKDPERLEEAEALLASARERQRSFPAIGEGPVLAEIKERYPPLAVRAAERFVLQDRPEYNPLFFVCQERDRVVDLLEATGRTLLGVRPKARVGIVSVEEFAEDFIRAISEGVAGAWRERWWSVDLFLLHGAEKLSETERAQDEFFHLFEALKRRNARILLAADRPPAEVRNIDERLRSRFEGGLVVEVEGDEVRLESPEAMSSAFRAAASREPPVPPLEELEVEDTGRGGRFHGDGEEPEEAEPVVEVPAGRTTEAAGSGETRSRDDLALIREFAGVGSGGQGEGRQDEEVVVKPPSSSSEAGDTVEEGWMPSAEKVVWRWLRLEDRIAEGED